jgi:G6PDH family F420-dependent oxidoreductase
VNVRHEILSEAVDIVGELFDGGYVNYVGRHYRVDPAKLWDLPERRTPIAVAVSGRQSVSRYAPVSDAMVAVEPKAELCARWDEVRTQLGQDASRKVGQMPVCWDPDRDMAVRRAHEQFRWFGGGGR